MPETGILKEKRSCLRILITVIYPPGATGLIRYRYLCRLQMRIITRTIWILSVVSMFADIASEMLYPVVPVYLREVGFSVMLIGLLEGLAEFTAGISKGYFGKQSDLSGKRLPFVRWGYFLSGVSKPLMAVFTFPAWIFGARTTDRLGKGLRTAARDAILSREATKETKARVFGFHRGWDTAGAFIGPVLALAWLQVYPGQYRPLFFWAFIPGMLAVAALFLLKERKAIPASVGVKKGFFSFFGYWKTAPPAYRKLVSALVLFAIANSSDVFLLLKTKEITGSDTTTILAYIFYNLVYALSSYPMGILADRFGMKKIFVLGLLLFALVYGGFALNPAPFMVFVLFFLYGLFAAASEGVAKAWISNISAAEETATAIGLYTSLQSICAFTASSIAGLIWSNAGSAAIFYFSSFLALVTMIYLLLIFRKVSG